MKNYIPLSTIIKPIAIILVAVALYVNEFNLSDFEKIVLFLLAMIYLELQVM